MKKRLIYWIQKAVVFVGNPYLFVVRGNGAIADTYHRLNEPWLRDLKIDTVLDIGANVGRFALTSRYLFPDARIISFEPIPSCYEQTLSVMKGDKNFIAYNCGLGSQDGEMSINVSAHNPSSSLLPMTDVHKKAFPFTAESSSASVSIKRLDSLANDLQLGKSLMIKVDVQGFEREVIMGGMETFRSAKMLLLELSYQELYQNQPLFDDIYSIVKELGFRFHGTLASMQHPETGGFLDADCIFLKA